MVLRILKMIAISGFLTALECSKFVFGRGSTHRRNNHGDRGRQVPPQLLGWGTSNVLVTLNFLVNINFQYVHGK